MIPTCPATQETKDFERRHDQVKDVEDRPIKTCAELCGNGSAAMNSERALVRWDEFLKVVRLISGISLARRNLQLYSSPQFRLVPKPVYARRHTAHYRHPEDTMRLAVVLHLRDTYYFPVAVIQSILKALHPRYYPAILSGLLAPDDIKALANAGYMAPDCVEVFFRRTSHLLTGLSIARETSWEERLGLGAMVEMAAKLRSRLALNRTAYQAEILAAGNGK